MSKLILWSKNKVYKRRRRDFWNFPIVLSFPPSLSLIFLRPKIRANFKQSVITIFPPAYSPPMSQGRTNFKIFQLPTFSDAPPLDTPYIRHFYKIQLPPQMGCSIFLSPALRIANAITFRTYINNFLSPTLIVYDQR